MVVWDAAADSKLYANVLKIKDVKLSAEDKDTLAKIMNCTPKAITHRMAHLKKTGLDEAAGDEAPTPKGRKKGKKAAESNDSDDEEDKPDRPKRGKAKRDYAELNGSEEGGDDISEKRVKTEEDDE